jgi:zinc transport system substrate-binding protein
MVKRISALVLTLALMLTGLTACNNTPESDKISIVVMIFPQYDWVREIIGEKSDRFDVTMLIGSSVDMHSYQPSMMDIARVATADLFIHIGGHSDGWVAGALAQSLNPDMVVINMVEALGDAIVMVEHDCSDDECDDDHHDNDGLIEEEHVWVSLRMARALCAIIAEAIIGLDPENADTYRQNLADYTLKLSDLDARYTEMAEAAPGNTVVFADRFPFLYMMNDYGIAHYAAFSGCSAEAEASFATIVQLSRRIDALELRFVMITETGSRDIAETIINATEARNQQILVLDGMKVATAEVSYLAIMESNLEVLREALS